MKRRDGALLVIFFLRKTSTCFRRRRVGRDRARRTRGVLKVARLGGVKSACGVDRYMRARAPPCTRTTRGRCPCRPNAHFRSVGTPSPAAGWCTPRSLASSATAAARARGRRPPACLPPVRTAAVRRGVGRGGGAALLVCLRRKRQQRRSRGGRLEYFISAVSYNQRIIVAVRTFFGEEDFTDLTCAPHAHLTAVASVRRARLDATRSRAEDLSWWSRSVLWWNAFNSWRILGKNCLFPPLFHFCCFCWK